MRKALITAGLLVVFGTSAIAQSPANVEKANRFRTNETKSNLVSTASAQEIKVQKQRELSNDTILKSSAQVKELGSRYAVAWSNNAAQLKELGSTYAVGFSQNTAQLKELGSTYAVGFSQNTAQLKELGSTYAVGFSQNAAQLKELGSTYAVGFSQNAAQLKELGTR